jgi:hypothetical protein
MPGRLGRGRRQGPGRGAPGGGDRRVPAARSRGRRALRPIGEYLAIQRRYRHLAAEQVAALQAEIDEGWARLQQRASASARAAM